MKLKRVAMLTAAVASIAACTLFSACAAIYTMMHPGYDVSAITATKKSNGIVFKITAQRKISDVEAWLGAGQWLYITIPDTSINVSQLNQLEGTQMVVKTEFFRYLQAVQVTLKLREEMDHVEIVRYPDSDDIYVVLYNSKSNS